MIDEFSEQKAWLAFRVALERAIGVPLGQYKEPQMKRRLANMMGRLKVDGWAAFALALKDKAVLEDVRNMLTINVSEFYRQTDRFTELQKMILPELMKGRRAIRIWSAGCSVGCEPYTLSMILNVLDPRGGHQIIATDVDAPILNRARAGDGYLPAEVRGVPPDILHKYFVFDGGTYKVVEDIKRRITFKRHDLLSDPYPPDLDLILCRNVVIYFNDDAKAQIYRGFAGSLKPGGYLFIGGSEMIMRATEIGFRSASTSIYRRVAA